MARSSGAACARIAERQGAPAGSVPLVDALFFACHLYMLGLSGFLRRGAVVRWWMDGGQPVDREPSHFVLPSVGRSASWSFPYHPRETASKIQVGLCRLYVMGDV
jgi:hypothetical protein